MAKPTPRFPKLKSFMLTNEDFGNIKILSERDKVPDSSIIRTALREHFLSNSLTVTSVEPDYTADGWYY